MDADPSAKISRSAAIWVALITALGGFATAVATGAIGLMAKKPVPVVQRWIRIEAVELGKDASVPRIDRVRLVVQINGVGYAYPTSINSVWAPVGPGMAIERYPLPMGPSSYHVRFFAFGLGPDGKILRYEFRGVSEHIAKRLPNQGFSQPLYLSTSAPVGLIVAMTVRYSFE